MSKDKVVLCRLCGLVTTEEQTKDWMTGRDETTGEIHTWICTSCYKVTSREGDQIGFDFGAKEIVHDAPLLGNFRRVKPLSEIERFRPMASINEEFWEFEFATLRHLNNKPHMLSYSIKNSDFHELKIKIIWDKNTVESISFTGNVPSKNQFLTIHQQQRLRDMGLVETAERNSKWQIALSYPENQNANVARIISHVLQFGFLIQSHKTNGISVTVDA